MEEMYLFPSTELAFERGKKKTSTLKGQHLGNADHLTGEVTDL